MKSSESGASAAGLLLAPHRQDSCHFRTYLWQTRRSGWRSLPPGRSASPGRFANKHRFPKRCLQSLRCLLRTVSRSGATEDLRGSIQVVAHGEFRPGARLVTDQRRQRNHGVLVVANIEVAQAVEVGAIAAFGFDIDL